MRNSINGIDLWNEYNDLSEYEYFGDLTADEVTDDLIAKFTEESGTDYDFEDHVHYTKLRALVDELGDDVLRHDMLIHEDDFVEYAQDLAEDCGMLDNCTNWPATCIDWDRAADELKVDYTEVEFEGETYYIRS